MFKFFGITEDKIGSSIRHALSIIGGVFIGVGIVEAESWSAVITHAEAIYGGAMGLYAFGASIYAKYFAKTPVVAAIAKVAADEAKAAT